MLNFFTFQMYGIPPIYRTLTVQIRLREPDDKLRTCSAVQDLILLPISSSYHYFIFTSLNSSSYTKILQYVPYSLMHITLATLCKTTKINSFYLIKFEETFLNFRIFKFERTASSKLVKTISCAFLLKIPYSHSLVIPTRNYIFAITGDS